MKTFTTVLLLFVSLSANAAPLTLGEALARVEAGHPWLRTRAATAALAQARQDAAGARPTGTVSLQLENALGTGEFGAARSLETTLQFSRALDWADRRAARGEAAAALNDAERRAWEENRRALLAEASRRFIRVVERQADLATGRELAGLARQTVGELEARGVRTLPADLARARLALTEADLAAEHAEHELLSARQNLAALWGAESPGFDHAEADLAALPAAESFEQLSARLTAADGPWSARQAALVRWRLAQERAARANAARGEPRWAAGLRRSEAADGFGLVLGLDYAWPSASLTGAAASEARAERERTVAEGEAALHELRAALHELCQELNHARIESEAVRAEMLPTARAWLAGVEAGLASGRYGTRDLLEARAALFAARHRETHAAAAYHATLVEIEFLLSAPSHRPGYSGHREP
jgi:outer membrane protein, heavy metal efflux system